MESLLYKVRFIFVVFNNIACIVFIPNPIFMLYIVHCVHNLYLLYYFYYIGTVVALKFLGLGVYKLAMFSY